jgi:hypothetical protein
MKTPGMKRLPALFLQVLVVLMALATLGFLLWEPHIEGRNAHATTFAIYFKDPFLAYVYLGSVAVFVAFQRAFGLLGHVRRTGSFSRETVTALRTIRVCALVVLGFVGGALAFILLFGDGEDRPAGVFMCALVALTTSGIAVVSANFARNLQSALRG